MEKLTTSPAPGDPLSTLQELTAVAKGFAPVPSLPLFLDFCAAKVVGRLPAGLRQPLQDAVLRIEPLEGTDGPGGLGGQVQGQYFG